jgi:hypothetical protein
MATVKVEEVYLRDYVDILSFTITRDCTRHWATAPQLRCMA